MAKILLINEKTLKSYTLINDNVDGAYILPAIQTAQDVDLETIIGPVLCNKLKSMVADGTIATNANYKLLLDDYVIPYLCWQVMSAIQVCINYKLTNSGVIQNDDTNKSRIDYNNSKSLQTQYEKYANSYATKLKNFLCANVAKYPEYSKCENYEYAMDAPLCSIFLADESRPKSYIGL